MANQGPITKSLWKPAIVSIQYVLIVYSNMDFQYWTGQNRAKMDIRKVVVILAYS